MAKVLYEKRNRIGYITLNRPDALNALDDELNDELWAVWRDFGEDDSVDVGVLTRTGKSFCSGAALVSFWRVKRLAGALLLPYLCWVSFATGLNWSVWQSNPALLR